MQATGVTEKQDPALRAFLRSIAGRWNFAYVSNGNQNWWYNHSSSRPKSEIHYLFAPHALFFESRPEFALPSITGCFAYGSGHKVSTELFDLELRKPFDSAATQTGRFKLSPNHKTLEMAWTLKAIRNRRFRSSNFATPIGRHRQLDTR